ELYQDGLAAAHPGSAGANAVIRLDGQRRCIWSGPAQEALLPGPDQGTMNPDGLQIRSALEKPIELPL
ncbi:MAG: hypothetical protein WBN80_02570, partial [Prochlorococcaceae cyanobacterium]